MENICIEITYKIDKIHNTGYLKARYRTFDIKSPKVILRNIEPNIKWRMLNTKYLTKR